MTKSTGLLDSFDATRDISRFVPPEVRGQRLRVLRSITGESVKDLVEATGCSKSAIEHWANGRLPMESEAGLALRKHFSVPETWWYSRDPLTIQQVIGTYTPTQADNVLRKYLAAVLRMLARTTATATPEDLAEAERVLQAGVATGFLRSYDRVSDGGFVVAFYDED